MLRVFDDTPDLFQMKGGQGDISKVESAAVSGGEHVTIPDAHFLFSAEFKRSGFDLLLTGEDGRKVAVSDYFRSDKRPALLSPEGAAFSTDMIDMLTGHRQYAQAGGPAGTGVMIGRVEKVAGSVQAIRNGVAVTLNRGDNVYKGDVVQTGTNSSVGISFTDGSAFDLTANARMAMTEFVYDPNGSANVSLLSLMQGTATFVSGQVARVGDMKIETPTATLGIRGTAGRVVMEAVNGQVNLSIFNYDQNTHIVDIIVGGRVIGQARSDGGTWTITPSGPLQALAQETAKTPQQIQQELGIVAQVLNTQQLGQPIYQGPPGQQNPNQTPPNPNPGGNGNNGSSTPTILFANTPNGSSTPVGLVTVNPTPVVNNNNNNTPPPGPPAPPQPGGPAPLSNAAPSGAVTITANGAMLQAVTSALVDPDGLGPLHYQWQRVGLNGVVNVGADQPTYAPTAADNGFLIQVVVTYTDGAGNAESVVSGGAIEVVLGNPPFIEGGTQFTRVAVPGGVSHAIAPDVSADGSKIVFQSTDDLPSGDNDGPRGDIYLFNRATGETIRITQFVPGAPEGETYDGAQISLNGKFVVFQGHSDFGPSRIYLYNVDTQELTFLHDGGNAHLAGGGQLVAMEFGGEFGNDVIVVDRSGDIVTDVHGDAPVWSPEINASGRYITFWTTASTVDVGGHHFTGLGNGTQQDAQVYLFDRLTGQLELVSGSQHDYAAISGHADVFGNNNSGALQVDEFGSGTGEDWVSSFSADGRYVVFHSNASNLVAGDDNDATDVFVYDRQTQTITRVSVGDGGTEANGDSIRPQISPDGRYVVFTSTADNLVDGDNNSYADTFVYDLVNHTIRIVSQTGLGHLGDGDSSWGDAVAGGGFVVAFGSQAQNLADSNGDGIIDAADDPNGDVSDILVADLSGGTKGVVVDDPNAPDGELETTGRLPFTDTDDTHTVTSVAKAVASTGHQVFGTLTAEVTTDTTGENTAGIITWHYQVDEALAGNLLLGETHTDVFTITVTDGEGNQATQDVSVTIAGTNQAPEVELVGRNALSFDGHDMAVAPAVSTQTDNVTFEATLRWNGGANDGHGQVIFYNGHSSVHGYGLFGDVVDGALKFSVVVGGVTIMESNASIAANELHDVALTRSGGVVHLYLDGVEQTLTNSTAAPHPIQPGDHTFVGGNPDNANEGFFGQIGNVALWDVARTATEINQDRSQPLSGTEPGLVGYWKLNDGRGSIAADSAPAGGKNDLLLIGNPSWWPGLFEAGVGTQGSPSAEGTLIKFDPNGDPTSFVVGNDWLPLPPAGNVVEYGGHFYKFFSISPQGTASWSLAAGAAGGGAAGGYLATINSAGENDAIHALLVSAGVTAGKVVYIGGSDAGHEGSWQWATGPDAGATFWNGGPSGNTEPGQYSNWRAGQPDNAGGGENFAVMQSDGTWSDSPDLAPTAVGFVVEVANYQLTGIYGGLVIATGTGEIFYSIDNDDPDTQALKAGQIVTDGFDIQVLDSRGAVTTRHLEFTIHGANDTPATKDDDNSIAADAGPVGGNVLSNDSDPENDPLTVTALDDGIDDDNAITVHGAYGDIVVTKATGAYTYTLGVSGAQHDNVVALADGEPASDFFVYTIADGHGGTAQGFVAINVTGANDAPTAADDALGTSQDGLTFTQDAQTTIPVSLLIGNDDDPDHDDVVSFNGFGPGHTTSATTANGGTVTWDGNSLLYTPAAGYSGPDSFTYSVIDSHDAVSNEATVSFDVAAAPPPDDNHEPHVAGDLSLVMVKGGGVGLTNLDLAAVDEDDPDPSTLTYTIVGENNVHVVRSLNAEVLQIGDTFTQHEIDTGAIIVAANDFTHDRGSLTVSLSDGVAGSTPSLATLTMRLVDAEIQVFTNEGLNFQEAQPFALMGAGEVTPGPQAPDHTFTIVNEAAGVDFVVQGSGFAYDGDNGNALTQGMVTAITIYRHDDPDHTDPLVALQSHFDAASFYAAIRAEAQGDHSKFEALTDNFSLAFFSSGGADAFDSDNNSDVFIASGGNDFFAGEGGDDRAAYTHAIGSIVVDLAGGTVVKFDANGQPVSFDTLRSIESITGTAFNDIFYAGATQDNPNGFSALSTNSGSRSGISLDGRLNEFEGRGGDDIITGNGDTRISYVHALDGVTVDLAAGTAHGTAPDDAAGVGSDILLGGVARVRGSNYDDFLYGSDNAPNTENFEGNGGDDWIDGRGGFDRAVYGDAFGGITADLANGTVTGADTGSDTLVSIEGVLGTDFADNLSAAGFSGTSLNAGSLGTFNEFEGRGGDDTITGNGDTRIAFYNATAGVTVTLDVNGSGTATGTAHSMLLPFANVDPANVGTDTIVSGVSRIRGSEFNDVLTGNNVDNIIEGRGGNDVLSGLGGTDTLTGGGGSDRFVYVTGGGNDVITDFDHSGAAFNHDEGDRIDLRQVAGVTGFGSLTLTAGTVTGGVFTAGAGGPDTQITGLGAGSSIILLGVTSGSLLARDFLFGGQVSITVQDPNGYNFGTLYDDLAGVNPALAAHDQTHYVVVNEAAGLIFSLVTNSGDFNTNLTGSFVNIINIFDSSYNMLASSNGWNIQMGSLLSAVQTYASSGNASGLDTIFVANATYNAIGSSHGSDGGDNSFHGDTFIASSHNDFFNGLTDASGDFNGGDTVDYSRALGPVTVNLTLQGTAQPTGGSGNDTLVNIENLRGSSFNDTLIGQDFVTNVLEGGGGDDTINGGGANDTASYQHAIGGVTVSLAVSGPQVTGGAGTDTLLNITNLRGSGHADTLTGNGNSMLEGGEGADHLVGSAGGQDYASYEHAATGVVANLDSPALNTGDAAGDTYTNINNLLGSRFTDTLTGNNNDNIIDSGFGGNDRMTGLAGADTFVFHSGQLTITDFTSESVNPTGHDLIDVSGLNNGSGFTDEELDALIASAHQGDDTLNFGDGNTVKLQGVDVTTLTHNDFIGQHNTI